MMRYGTGFDIDHIFVTHMHGDHVLGLPGLVQTWDFNGRDEPLAIHAPSGTRERVERLVAATGDRPSFPVRIHQVSPGEDALSHEEYTVQAIDVRHRTNAVGYVIDEDDRKGRFDREYAEEELGLSPGPEYSKLHNGQSVEHDGRTIHPEEVVGPPRPGRRLVYTGDTRPCDSVVAAADGADLLIHDSMFADDRVERARETGHSTAREAAEVANDAGAKRLALTHISSRYAGHGWHDLESEAEETFAGEELFVAEDGMEVEIPYPDADRDFAVERASR
jgi:ribonuclease Z